MRNQQSGAYPHCVALYDFDAENPGELSFKVSHGLYVIKLYTCDSNRILWKFTCDLEPCKPFQCQRPC